MKKFVKKSAVVSVFLVGFLVGSLGVGFIAPTTPFTALNTNIAHAQAAIGTASVDGIDISTSPANPAPGDTVTVSIVSYTTNLNGATVNWLSSGKSFSKGTGITSVTVQAPPIGKTVQIMATIDTVEGATIHKVATIKSSSVDMVWETSGYVPPLYRGKYPFVSQNTLKIIAIPHLSDGQGNPIDPKTLIYTWKQDSTVLGDQSGYDKQSVTITGTLISRPFTIDVQVSSADGTIHGEGQIGVVATTPSVEFYQDDPLYGVLYNEAVNTGVNLLHNQLKIVAAPYGFDVREGSLTYNWTINDTAHDELADSTSIILATPSDGSSGTSDVGLSIQNPDKILQTASAGFSAVFNNTSAQNTSVSF